MKQALMVLLAGYCWMGSSAQLKWTKVDSLFQPLPSSIHIYLTDEPIDTTLFRAYYLIADLKDKQLDFTVDTTLNRRLTPSKFYQKNQRPLVVTNCTFFSFENNRNLNVVIKNGKLLGYNVHTIAGKGQDTLTYRHPFGSAIGIDKKRKGDVAWTYTDSSMNIAYATQSAYPFLKDSLPRLSPSVVPQMRYNIPDFSSSRKIFHRWKMKTAVGGGPVLVERGLIKITNEEELKFIGKAINDKHPRTAMGYTKDAKLIILVIQGRSESSGGASLPQEAKILQDLGCWEALNLDGGGSSCMLVNGKETIKPSDKEGQRPIPAVFVIKKKD